MRAIADLGRTDISSTVVATRGARVALTRTRYSSHDQGPEAFVTEILSVTEMTNSDNRVAAQISFDVDDIDSAVLELDARYLAGEAAAHTHTWSVIAGLSAGFNRRERPATTPDFSYIDHRRVITIEATDPDLSAFIRADWDLMPEISIYMEAVHRLSDLGVVVTHTARGVSHEDFDVEWRMINLFRADGNLISRCEMFDEADLDAALARFEDLEPK
jgi:hypothetical protein